VLQVRWHHQARTQSPEVVPRREGSGFSFNALEAIQGLSGRLSDIALSAAAGAGHRGSFPTRQQVGAAAACAMCISCLLPIRRSAGETCAISTPLEFGHHSANTIYCISHTWSSLVCNNNAALWLPAQHSAVRAGKFCQFCFHAFYM
jgi:hypothetical protein